jgi:predicted transposase/invertase (TIGR01784 family)
MIFIDPKTDFAFKKIFGSEQSRGILISFLNGIVYGGKSVIKDLEILNPYQVPRIRGVKDTYLDVKAQLNTGETVIIEMQVLNVEGFEKRILYNAAKAYSIQLSAGQNYPMLNPVIALTITDFEMFPEIDAVISRFVLKEKDYLINYLVHDLELVFVELPKFKQPLEAIDTLTDKWIYFLQHVRDLRVVPDVMGTVPEIQQAFEIANQANLTLEEFEELENQLIFIQDQRGAITKAVNQGLQQGIQQGVQQGIQQGIQQGVQEGIQQGVQQGIQQGRQEAQLEVARRSLSVLDDVTIGQITGLTVEEVNALRRG